MNHERLFKYIGIAAIALLLFGLLGWYLFIARQTASIEDAGEARGFSVGIPSFLGSRGSTAANTSFSGSGGGAASAEEVVQGQSGASAFLRFLGIGSSGEGVRANTTIRNETTSDISATTTEKRAPRFWRVSATPVAGLAFTASTSRLRYVERATGYVFDVDAETGSVVRITNTLTPKTYEAYIGSGNVVMLRTLDATGPVTLSGKIGTTTEEGLAALQTTDLGIPLRALATLSSSPDILMLSPPGVSANLTRAKWNGGSSQKLLAIPAGDFRIHWSANSRIALVEKAGSGIAGSAFRVSTSLVPLLTNIPGLTILPHPTSDTLLYSSDTGSKVTLFIKPQSATAVEIPLQTVTEKCVWAPNENSVAYCAVPQERLPEHFLDTWYRGETHTEDIWYTVNASAATAEKLFTIDSASAVDVESPVMDAQGQYVAFINARDKSLWILRIKE